MDLFLQDGARVGIIGGGPSGSFTAIHLLSIAASLNKKIKVFIFDKKDFTSGLGCNFCAGILSNTLIKELVQYNIIIPPEIIQREIKGYYYETREGTAYFPKPSTSSIFSVFRANGPCSSKELYNVSFDYFLLQEAIKRGANKIDTNINEVIFPSTPQDRVSLYSQEQNTYYEFELVFGAFGINTPFIKELEKSGIGYKAPKYLHSGQAEIPYDISLNKKFHDNVTVFLIPLRNLYFFSFTPKAEYLTVTAIGPHVTKAMLEEIFTIPQVMKYFPDKWQFPLEYCHCHPRISVTIAENFFYHRFVVVGDACWSRYLKDGIASAFYTSKFGVECAFKYGISRNAFRDRYFREITRMDKDNTVGKILFKIHNRLKRSQTVRGSLFSMTRDYYHKTIQENVRYILWGLFTGDYSYKKIMRKSFRISFIVPFIINIINAYLKIIFNNLSKINKKTKLRPIKNQSSNVTVSNLVNGDTIIVIGGGPAGTSCAIHAKKLAVNNNIDLSVILIEPKTFSIHYNQCVGVLSPRIKQLMGDIGIDFPEHLIQTKIPGYYLNANGEEIYLPSDKHNDIGLALRRNEFDAFMIEQALRNGVQVVRGEVVTFDYSKNDKKNKFIVYCNSGTYKCNFIVGAFGVGNGIALDFFKTFRYRPPHILQSIVSKIHPLDNLYIDEIFGNNIHTYLPKYKAIEFGAITPKGNHLTVNIAGEKISFKDMEYFLMIDEVKKWIPPHKERTYFKGQFPTSPAHRFYGDNYLIIGDAAGLVRPFKGKGVNSAILSGKIAAETIVNYGTTALAIKRNFVQHPQIQKILIDYKYGKIIRKLTIQASHHNLLKYIINYAKRNKTFETALYNAVSANRLYKDIILCTLRNLVS